MKLPVNNSSNSQLSTYFECARKWKFDKIEKEPFIPGAGLLIGNATDNCCTGPQGYFTNVINGSPHIDYEELFMSECEASFRHNEGTLFAKQEVETFAGDRDKIRPLIKEYCREGSIHHKHLEPLEVQKRIEITFKHLELPYIGYIDLVAKEESGRLCVVDQKAMKNRTGFASKSQVYQIALYSFGVLLEKQDVTELPHCELHGFLKLKTPEIDVHHLWPSEDDISQVVLRATQFEWGIRNEWFPLNRTSHLCSPKYCSYYHKCHEQFKRDLPTLIRYVRG